METGLVDANDHQVVVLAAQNVLGEAEFGIFKEPGELIDRCIFIHGVRPVSECRLYKMLRIHILVGCFDAFMSAYFQNVIQKSFMRLTEKS